MPFFIRKRWLFIQAVVLYCTDYMNAGDVATYVDLGFSPDGAYYMFAQYGVETKTLRPWSELFIVDVPKNNFVKDGKHSYIYTGPIVAGQDGSGAFYTLLTQQAQLAQKYSIDFLRQSRPLYLAIENGKETTDPSSIEFRDFKSNTSFIATIVSYIEGEKSDIRSSFFINVERSMGNGEKKKYVVGTPSLKRPGILSYKIRKVMIAPGDGSMIFVIEMNKQGPNGIDVRYMVEALRL